MTEGWDREFLKRHFKNSRGSLYDGGFLKDVGDENAYDELELSALQNLRFAVGMGGLRAGAETQAAGSSAAMAGPGEHEGGSGIRRRWAALASYLLSGALLFTAFHRVPTFRNR